MSHVPMSSVKQATYTHGHHESALRAHEWRTVANSTAYVIPYLKPNLKILDVGCGPGTITVDLASVYVLQGHVTGLDYGGEVIERARKHASERKVTNVTFLTGDAHALPFLDFALHLHNARLDAVVSRIRDWYGVLHVQMIVRRVVCRDSR